jgi:hypothetical protein
MVLFSGKYIGRNRTQQSFRCDLEYDDALLVVTSVSEEHSASICRV